MDQEIYCSEQIKAICVGDVDMIPEIHDEKCIEKLKGLINDE